VWFVQNHCTDLRHGYDHLLRYKKTTQALKASQSMTFRRRYLTEFTGRAVLRWAGQKASPSHCFDTGRPQQNALIASFNGSLRDELLNGKIFDTLGDARRSWPYGATTTTLSD